MARVESVRYNGVLYRRYPDATGASDRAYFVAGIADRQRGYKRLHEDVWRAHNGDIPPGHHIHHADHDTDNNEPGNLVALTAAEHIAYHADDRRGICTDAQYQHLARIRPLAAVWHGTPEGLEWHRQHGHATWAKREAVALTCEQCGGEYETKSRNGAERFCSNLCKSAWRRAAGLDDEHRSCGCCGGGFTANRYARTRFCSRRCSVRHASRQSCGCVQPDGQRVA